MEKKEKEVCGISLDTDLSAFVSNYVTNIFVLFQVCEFNQYLHSYSLLQIRISRWSDWWFVHLQIFSPVLMTEEYMIWRGLKIQED